jgi:hypothetical protein
VATIFSVVRRALLAALPLFILQVIFGILGSIKYVWGTTRC